MITESILLVFAIIYYLFSVFFVATIVQDTNEKYNFLQIMGKILCIMLLAIVVTPIVLAIEIGDWIINK